MSIEIREATDNPEAWSRCVERSPQSTIFHQNKFLELMEEHSEMKLWRLVGYKGQEPIGALPLYATSKGPANIVYSPPPSLGTSYLGPIILNMEKLKRRKQERRSRRFVEGCLDWIDSNIGPKYVHVRSTVNYDDPRAFQWSDFNISPQYTYTLDLNRDLHNIKQSFSKSLRRYLNPDPEESVEISVGGQEEIEFIFNQIQARYEAQDRDYPLTLEFVKNVNNDLEDRVKPYIGRVDGKMAAGILVLEDDTTRYFWQGGGKPDSDYPINDLLHWHIIKDGHEAGLEKYDLYGANTERLCEYKTKFNTELKEYYDIKRETLVSKAYEMIQ